MPRHTNFIRWHEFTFIFNGDTLEVNMLTHFTDDSGRDKYTAHETLREE